MIYGVYTKSRRRDPEDVKATERVSYGNARLSTGLFCPQTVANFHSIASIERVTGIAYYCRRGWPFKRKIGH
jgi:hypothetical protein